MEEHGEAPRRWHFSQPRLARFGPIRGPRIRTQAPKHTPPSAHLTHPLEVTAVPQGPWAPVRGHRSPSCHLEDHGISAGDTAQKHSQPRTDTVRRIDLWTWGLGGEFSRELSKGQVPSVALGVPTPSLNPAGHYHPAISSPLPPRGSNTWAYCASTWRTCRQTRRPLWPEPTTAKIPLFFHP